MIKQYMDKIKDGIDDFFKNIGVYSHERQCDKSWKTYAESWVNRKNEENYETDEFLQKYGIIPAYVTVDNTINFPKQEKVDQYTTLEVMMA